MNSATGLPFDNTPENKTGIKRPFIRALFKCYTYNVDSPRSNKLEQNLLEIIFVF
jgi:hypothetical protein